MKKLVFYLLLLATVNSLGQELKSSKTTLIQLSYFSQTVLLNSLDKYNPATTREKERFSEFQNQLDIEISNLFYDKLMETLNSNGINLEARNSLENYGIMYKNGFPFVMSLKSGVKKASKKGYESDYFFSAKLSTTVDTGLLSGSTNMVNKFIPIAEVTIDIVDSSGKKVKTIKHAESTEEKVENKAYFGKRFDKTNQDNLERLVELFQPLIEKAVEESIAKI